MKKETQELSRRQMLAAMAISSLGGIAKGSLINKPKGANPLVPDRKSRGCHIRCTSQPRWPTERDGAGQH